MVAPQQSISGVCYRGMFLAHAARLMWGSGPRRQAREVQGAARVCYARLTFQGALPGHRSMFRPPETSGVRANVSTRADGRQSMPTAPDCDPLLAWKQPTSEHNAAHTGTEWDAGCLQVI